jgi:hypothetical protein
MLMGKILCKKQVISRSYFKLYEMVYHEPLISQLDPLHCFFICEAPGGFIESLSDIRRKKNLRLRYLSVSKYDQCIKYDRYLEESQLMYSDVTNPENLSAAGLPLVVNCVTPTNSLASSIS